MTGLSRRAFAFSIPAASIVAGWPLSAGNSSAEAALSLPQQVVPLAQIKIGRFTVTALVDGFADMPFSYFPGRSPEQVEADAAALSAAKPGGVRFVFNQYLLDDGEQRVLIDSGPGGYMGQTGDLPSALEAIGVSPDSIGAVIITHLHIDHFGGLIAGGKRNYPKAEVYADQRDVAYWTDPAKRAAAPDFLAPSFDGSTELVRLYPDLQATDGEREIVPGISLIDLTGHTPGHIGVRVHDGEDSLIMASDMLFPVVHPGHPQAGFLFEQDPAAAQAMRKRFFPRAAKERTLVAATHMPFPGLGHIISDRGEFRWVPAEWAYRD